MKKPPLQSILFCLAFLAPPLLGGCGGPPPVSPHLHQSESRSQKLMALAAEEAGKIAEPDQRLTRQLNLADLQISRDWTPDARTTLGAARKTLASPEAAKLNDHARISGWVSISELSRRIDDMPSAATATDTALREMDKIEDPSKRCQYVMGLANELQYIKGKPAAAALLAKAGPWTKSIDNLALRRQALVAFSTALFNLDDFEAGRTMLGHETDAAWRSDVLAGMAQTAMPQDWSKFSVVGHSAEFAGQQAPAATQPYFGKSLTFDQVFKNQKNSQTSKD